MKALKRITCLILAFIMCFGSAAAIYGDANSKIYIDDIKIGYGEDGKKALINAGYVVESSCDVNKGGRGDADSYGDTSVWIGLHKTDNALDAITDVAVMSMNGGYSFSDWASEYAALQSQIADMLEDFMDGIKEFRTNLKNGSPYAEEALEIMNQLIDSGFTNKRIGDLLKNESTSDDTIKNIFIMGNYSFIRLIKQCIAVGCTEWKSDESGNYNTFVNRLNSNGYCIDTPDPSMNHERELISDALSELKTAVDSAEIARAEYYSIYSRDKDSYKLDEKDIPENCTADELDKLQFEKYIMAKCTESQQLEYGYYDVIISLLKQITIKPEVKNDLSGEVISAKVTFYDLVKKNSGELTENDFETIRLSMTEGQIGVLDSVGFPMLLIYAAGVGTGDYKERMEELWDETEDYGSETISVYYGVDINAFTDSENTALTTDALRAMKSSENCYFGVDTGADTNAIKKYIQNDWLNIIYGGIGGVAIGSFVLACIRMVPRTGAAAIDFVKEGAYIGLEYSAPSTTGTVITSVFIVIAVIVIIVAVVLHLQDKKEKPKVQEDITYTKIPKIIVDKKTVNELGVGEQSVYYTYNCAERIDANKKSSNDLKVYGDLNQYNKKDEWLCVYYTKNRDCGNPITTGMMLRTDSQTPSGYVAIHDFGSSAASNLNLQNSGTYDAVYAYIKTTTFSSASGQTASVFSRGATIMIATAAFIVGAGAAGAVTYSGTKRKYKKA